MPLSFRSSPKWASNYWISYNKKPRLLSRPWFLCFFATIKSCPIMENIRVVELFAGVGGFRLGLEQASSCFQTVWANQWEPSMRSQFAFECYERHFGHRPEHVCQDIVTAKGNIPPHDLSGLFHRQKGRTGDRREEGRSLVGDQRYPTNTQTSLCPFGKRRPAHQISGMAKRA